METKALATVTDLYINYGVTAVIVIAFFVLVFWVLKTSKEREEAIQKSANDREDKLYTIIDSLSEQLPGIREALIRVESKLDIKK